MRRRQLLQVNTFPFLAVLLCAMGSLILVLLVMDRRSKKAAQERAHEQMRRQTEDRAIAHLRQKNALETKKKDQRSAWEKKQTALRTRLDSEEKVLTEDLSTVQNRLAEAARNLRREEESVRKLRNQLEKEKNEVTSHQQALDSARQEISTLATRAGESERKRAKLAADLIELEKHLADLKAARERDQNTYSIVPYRGKRGENSRPLYVECAPSALIFHPEGLKVDGGSSTTLKTMVERQIARQKEALVRQGVKEVRPYLMLLVRPDGVQRYYQMQAVLREMGADFGYELVDPDWVFHIPEDKDGPNLAGDSEKEGPALAREPAPTRTVTSAKPRTEGPTLAFGPQQTSENASGRTMPPGSPGVPGSPRLPGPRQAPAGGTGIASGAPSAGAHPDRGLPSSLPPSSTVGLPSTSGTASVGMSRPLPFGSPSSPEGGPELGAPMASPGPAAIIPVPTGAIPGPAGTPTGSTGTAAGPIGPPTAQGQPEAPVVSLHRPVTRPGSATSTIEAPELVPSLNPGTEKYVGNTPSAAVKAPPGNGTGSSGNGSAAGGGPSLGGPSLGTQEGGGKPLALKPARIGAVETTLYVECRADVIVVHPGKRQIAYDMLNTVPSHNPLCLEINNVIARRRAVVRSGETAPRFQVRFLVHRDGERTFHRAYPLAYTVLAIESTSRYNLQPEDDVSRIVVGD